jgi:integrase
MASVKAKFKTDKTLKDGTHPIVIQVIHNRRRKVFYLGFSATKSQWDEDKNTIKSNHPDSALIKSRIKNATLILKTILVEFENKHQQFSLEDVERKYKLQGSDEKFIGYVDGLIKSFQVSGKKGNAIVYQNCRDSVSAFIRGKDVPLVNIDYAFITKYQKYLENRLVVINKGKETEKTKRLSLNTISVYLRTLRAIMNKAIKDGLIEESAYPFKNISIKSQKTRKRAVNKDVISMVEDFECPEGENLQLYKDLFMFSFYNRGMNFVDMAFLQNKNIQGGRINYTRQKTGQQFSIKITDKSKAIIDRYNDSKDPESYIFPILYRKGQEYLDYRNAMRLMNKKLKRISELLKLDVSLTTYVARHSWATIAKKSGISTAIISEGLGHESEETTQVYLDSFENDVLDDANDLIIGL